MRKTSPPQHPWSEPAPCALDSSNRNGGTHSSIAKVLSLLRTDGQRGSCVSGWVTEVPAWADECWCLPHILWVHHHVTTYGDDRSRSGKRTAAHRGKGFGMLLMSTFMDFRLSSCSLTVFRSRSQQMHPFPHLALIFFRTNKQRRKTWREKKEKGSGKRQTLNMQTVKKNKLVANWNVWSESGYVYILKLWKSFPRKYFTKAQTDFSVIK